MTYLQLKLTLKFHIRCVTCRLNGKNKSGENNMQKWICIQKVYTSFFYILIFFSVVTWAWRYHFFFFICMSLVALVLSVRAYFGLSIRTVCSVCATVFVHIDCAAELCACRTIVTPSWSGKQIRESGVCTTPKFSCIGCCLNAYNVVGSSVMEKNNSCFRATHQGIQTRKAK